ncbi:MAG: hypothetical protein JNG85_17585, partial [Spirochaetaceae bacterium]|nr:hypothetical protein [Spirochaetaceae bacterium]
PARSHANFVHGYEVPLWSGPLVRWLLPRMGALPVYHAKYAAASLRNIRRALLDGKHPLALAPEGQVSYRSETVPRLEQGTARLAFWCAEELAAAGRPERVIVLPLSVHNRYDETDLTELEAFVGGLESDCGIPRDPASPGMAPRVKTTACCGDPGSLAYKPPPPADGGASRRAILAARLRRLDERLLCLAEGYYGLRPAAASGREDRRAALLEEALRRGEAMLGLPSEPARDPLSAEAAENRISRVYRIRQAGWDRIYPEGGIRRGSPLERRLENRLAGEAWYAMRHMELVDLLHYLDGAYLDGKPSMGRLVETASSLGDLAMRLVGGDISHRPNPLAKAATIVVAPPLDLGARLGEYAADKRAATARATADLESAYLSCIKENPHA